MTKHFTIFLLLTYFGLGAQISTDNSHGSQTMTDNRFGPFHQTIRDTTQRTVSKFGHYISAGVGGGRAYGIVGVDAIFSYSLAYKSLLFSVTHASAGVIGGGGGLNDAYYKANYTGLLIGESLRFKYSLISLSTGIAISNVYIYTPHPRATYDQEGIISIPVELKIFLLARNGVGLGLHFSKNIISQTQYSPFFYGLSIVFGGWNKSTSSK